MTDHGLADHTPAPRPLATADVASDLTDVEQAFDRLACLIETTGVLNGLPLPEKRAINQQIGTIRFAIDRAYLHAPRPR